MNRAEEIRELQRLPPDEMLGKAKGHLIVVENLDALHRHFAQTIFDEIERNNRASRPTRLILPVGPTGQYPLLAEMINQRRLSLARCHFFFMDEYCDESGAAIPPEHPLSFKGHARAEFLNRIDPALNIPAEQLFFPDDKNLDSLAEAIGENGVDTCYGGIGIHGHVAFNEPEPGVKHSGPRRVRLNDYTLTINAIRSEVGGNLEGFPRTAITLGMRQILGARRIRLYCRNGGPYDWANTVLRLALFGRPGDDYPVTYIRETDYLIVADTATAARPKVIL